MSPECLGVLCLAHDVTRPHRTALCPRAPLKYSFCHFVCPNVASASMSLILLTLVTLT